MATYRNIYASASLDPDLSAGFDSGWVISSVFREPSNIDPHTSHLRTQAGFVTPLSFDLKPEIAKPTFRNIVVSANLDPDL